MTPQTLTMSPPSVSDARELAANAPLPLGDADGMWLVEAGMIDVFAVPQEAGQTSGARVHLFRAAEGNLLVGCANQGDAVALVAVGNQGGRVRSLDIACLRTAHSDAAAPEHSAGAPSTFATVARSLSDWVAGLTGGVARERPPRAINSLSTKRPSHVAAVHSAVQAGERLVWIRVETGVLHFLGKPELSVGNADGAIPLASHGWFTAAEEARITVLSTEAVAERGEVWTGLQRFQRLITEAAAKNIQDQAVAERDRLQRKSTSEQRLAKTMLSRLAAVVASDASGGGGPGEIDPLLAACRLVGQYQKIAIRPPRTYGQKQWSTPVNAIARASEVRTRRVILGEHWWQQENGPLVGFWTEGEKAVALLPLARGGYEAVDPVTQERRRVTAELSAQLRPFAHCFYRPFPTRPLRARDVFVFALLGTRREWIAIALLGLAGAVLGMVVPVATGWVFSRIIPNAEYTQLWMLILALAASAAVMAMFEFVQGIATLRLETKMDTSVESAVWDRLLNLPASFFRRFTAGDLALRANGIGEIRHVVTEAAMSTVLTFMFSWVSFALLFYYDKTLAMLGVLMFLVVVAITVFSAFMQLPYERQGHELRGRVAGIVLQLLTGISRLRVAGAENRALSYWAKSFSEETRMGFLGQSIANLSMTILSSVPIIVSAVIFSSMVMSPGAMPLATFLAFNVALTTIITAAISTAGTVTSILDIIPLYERAQPILQAAPEFHRAKRDPGDLTGDIEVSRVSFRYQADGPLILDDVSLHIRPGEFVAFVGPSGAGKSTIFRLLLGFESPTTGAVYYDREDLAGLDQQSVRRQVGVVLQNSRLSSGDIQSNIIGSSTLTVDDAWEAARMSGLADDIDRMPMGMYTVISDGESTLSGGQRQRLMIARAIAGKPKILLFDEATSALDNATQAQVSESLENLKATRIVVAHRLSTILYADRIFVLQGGKIVQEGNYQQLIAQPGLFAELAKRQLT